MSHTRRISPRYAHDHREIDDTLAMANGLNVGGDVERALANVGVPSYVLDATG